MLALPVATADTGTIIAAAQCALAAIWRPGLRYKKARVILLDPVKADRVQALFDRPDDAGWQARMRLSTSSTGASAAMHASMALQA